MPMSWLKHVGVHFPPDLLSLTKLKMLRLSHMQCPLIPLADLSSLACPKALNAMILGLPVRFLPQGEGRPCHLHG